MQLLRFPAHAGISGFESPANEYIDLKLSIDDLLISHPNASFMGRASGDSMVGFGIFDGDLLIIDRAAALSDFDIVAATLNGNFVCKAIDRKRRQLVSALPERVTQQISDEDDYQEEGVVISSIRLHRMTHKMSTCLR